MGRYIHLKQVSPRSPERETFEQKLEESEQVSLEIFQGRTFQVREQQVKNHEAGGYLACVWGTTKKPVFLEWSK